LPNAGEEDEPIIIAKLVSLKGTEVDQIGKIMSVASYNGIEYNFPIASFQIAKAPTTAKRDVIINGKGYSLKSIRARPPAIVNHTTREKWIRVCEVLDEKIDMLDEMVREYWELRINRKVGEDVFSSSTLYCPFGNNPQRREYLRKLIDYFLFQGTGSKDSEYPANYILEFGNAFYPFTWRVLTKTTAFDLLWPKMVFSVRSQKGMPPDYANMSDPRKKALIEPWVKYIDGDYRGSLHIRSR
jgi:hypothetical protein